MARYKLQRGPAKIAKCTEVFSTNFYNLTTKALIVKVLVYELFYSVSCRTLQREIRAHGEYLMNYPASKFRLSAIYFVPTESGNVLRPGITIFRCRDPQRFSASNPGRNFFSSCLQPRSRSCLAARLRGYEAEITGNSLTSAHFFHFFFIPHTHTLEEHMRNPGREMETIKNFDVITVFLFLTSMAPTTAASLMASCEYINPSK